MVRNLLQPVVESHRTKLVRYEVYFGFKTSLKGTIKGVAHSCLAGHPIFLDKFINVIAPKYFQ